MAKKITVVMFAASDETAFQSAWEADMHDATIALRNACGRAFGDDTWGGDEIADELEGSAGLTIAGPLSKVVALKARMAKARDFLKAEQDNNPNTTSTVYTYLDAMEDPKE